VIDFGRAIQSAWERMLVILFEPFDIGKWGLLGFNAFLALLAEGGVAINNPIPGSNNNEKTSFEFNSTEQALRAFKQFTTWVSDLPNNPWLKIMICAALAYVVIWLVLNWVGCRAQFVFLDNIVRNRAALAAPWQRYGHQGNVWFLFHLGLVALTALFFATAAGVFLFLNWTWISAARDPAGTEAIVAGLALLVFGVLGLIGTAITFLIRSLVLPLYFKQTMSLGTALLAVMSLVFTRPLSLFVYLLLSFVLAILSGFITCCVFMAAFCVTLSIVCWVSCFPFIGGMLMSMVLCQLILPLLVFQRCFQLGVLEQFGPQYEVFRVDVPPAPGY
jgi:hypothetical protein